MDLTKAIEAAKSEPAAYVLQGSDGAYLYKGACRNLVARLKKHRVGGNSRTKNRRPLALVHFEHFQSYSDALKREKYLKSKFGRIWLKRLLAKPHSP